VTQLELGHWVKTLVQVGSMCQITKKCMNRKWVNVNVETSCLYDFNCSFLRFHLMQCQVGCVGIRTGSVI